LNKEDIQKILAKKETILQSEDLDQLESFKMEVKKYTKTIERVLEESTESDESSSAKKKSEEGGDE